MKCAILLAAVVVVYGHPTSKSDDDRVYTFGIGRDEPPFEFYDANTNTLGGFGMDMVREACTIAEKNCEFIGYKDYSLCWDSKAEMAHGLSQKYFDACVNWLRTPARDLNLAFSIPFAEEGEAFLYTREGNRINPDDLTANNDFKIVSVSGFAQDAGCLRRNGVVIDDNNMLGGDGYADVYSKLDSGEADLAFLPTFTATGDRRYVRVGPAKKCAMQGISVTVRKDQRSEVLSWLNPALETIINSPDYSRFCYIAKQAYGGNPLCLKPKKDEI